MDSILERLVFDPTLAEDVRYWALVLLVYHIQFTSMDRCLQLIDKYLEKFPNDKNQETIGLLRHSMQERQELYLY
jgi:adenosine deaminase